MKLKTVTLGCRVNQYETDYLREGLRTIGYEDALESEFADLCIVNTCTVTSEGDSKSRKVIRKLARENPSSKIVVMGCYATRAPEEVKQLPNVTEVLTDKRELSDLLGRFGVTDIPTGVTGSERRRQRAYVKVQDGCMLRCSFCIIPHVRPELTSRPPEHIISEVKQLLENGYHEVVLTGIHLGHYGVDWCKTLPKNQWTRLSHLVRMLAEIPGDFRIRLSSIEATEVTRELIEVMSDYPEKVAPHLHISMQSGSESVLRRMNRRWGRQRYIDRCAMLNERLEQPAITTDIIVGFPGETEAEFEETCEVVREVGFSKIHIFPFSARRGTPAYEMPNQLPKSVKQARGRELARLETEMRTKYFNSLLGRPLRMMVESEYTPPKTDRPQTERSQTGHSQIELVEKTLVTGTSCRYASVVVPGSLAQLGQFIRVVGESTDGERIFAREV